MADRKVILSMRIAGGSLPDLYPYELFLEEGFSHVYKARLKVLSDVGYRAEDLLEVLDTRISLVISQVLRDAATTRTRYFHGIITAAAAEGVFSSGDQHCYQYTLTIESPLARLRYNMRNATYYRKSPVDALEAVLANNKITAQFPAACIDRTDFSTRLMFNQNGISDLDFIANILFTYGISFTNTHPAAENAVADADLVFSGGDRFPKPVLEYSDGREAPDKALFDFVRADEKQDILKMDAFRMETSIGTDGIEVTAVYPEFNYGNKEWKIGEVGAGERSFIYNRLFSGYERGTTAEEINADVQRVLTARQRGFDLAKVNWGGKAANLLVMPGALFELAHFYGLDDESRITAMVTAAKTHVRAVWPEKLAVKAEAAEKQVETVEIGFSCMDYKADIDRRFCGALVK
ncbi:MAG: phage late control D family protein [Spirochaetaceae bacterium]|jgi:uncharacterized protein involved in type VI secretion and phage assembly|nr:phage late control D family protein [Spirochaetaceae bacterium]